MLHRPFKQVQPRVSPIVFLFQYNRRGYGIMTAALSQDRALLAGLRARLPRHPPGTVRPRPDHAELVPGPVPPVRAAVLLPVVGGPTPALLLTRRATTLMHHSGQISFPGGRCEASDRTPARTALRETREEVGISPRFIHLAGFLDRYVTGTGFDIQPVVGVLAPGFTLAPEAREVAEIFQVPLAFLCDPANRVRGSRVWNGRVRSFYVYRWASHEIWGATAAIIADLAERIGREPVPPHSMI